MRPYYFSQSSASLFFFFYQRTFQVCVRWGRCEWRRNMNTIKKTTSFDLLRLVSYDIVFIVFIFSSTEDGVNKAQSETSSITSHSVPIMHLTFHHSNHQHHLFLYFFFIIFVSSSSSSCYLLPFHFYFPPSHLPLLCRPSFHLRPCPRRHCPPFPQLLPKWIILPPRPSTVHEC